MHITDISKRAIHLLTKNGVPLTHAQIVVKILLDASRQGHLGQGIERLPAMITGITRGTLNARPYFATKKIGAFSTIDANQALGPVAGSCAIRNAIYYAKELGLGVVGITSHGHLGRMGWYTHNAAEQGFVAFATCTASPTVTGPGGVTPVFGTNPLAFSFPYGEKEEICTWDSSLAAISNSDIYAYKVRGEMLPLGVALDCNGLPTQDPDAALAGSILPLSGTMEGLGLNLFSAILTMVHGGEPNHLVTGSRDTTQPQTLSSTYFCFNMKMLTNCELFLEQSKALLVAAKESMATYHIPGSRKPGGDEIPLSPELEELLQYH